MATILLISYSQTYCIFLDVSRIQRMVFKSSTSIADKETNTTTNKRKIMKNNTNNVLCVSPICNISLFLSLNTVNSAEKSVSSAIFEENKQFPVNARFK